MTELEIHCGDKTLFLDTEVNTLSWEGGRLHFQEITNPDLTRCVAWLQEPDADLRKAATDLIDALRGLAVPYHVMSACERLISRLDQKRDPTSP